MKVLHFESIDSTSTYLKNNYQDLDNMTFVSADYQSAGHGRNNRNWKSENGSNLLFSLLILDRELINLFKSISIISAYSTIEVLKEYGISNCFIKWPNDIYVNDEKICGILLEAVTKSQIECLIVGIGLNVNQKVFEGEYLRLPTSMCKELNKEVDLNELKLKVFNNLEKNLIKLKEGYDFYSEIKDYDYLKGKEVYSILNNEEKKISVLGINPDYSLKIKDKENIIDIDSGEISFHTSKI